MNPFAIIEDKLGYPIPESYKSFLLATDNDQYINKLFPRVFEDGDIMYGRIEAMIPIDRFWKYNDYRQPHLDELQAHFEHPVNYVESEHLYIIIEAVSMSICMAFNGIHKGKIYCADNGDFGIMYQADTLEGFLQSLIDYDGKAS